jgi:predicted metal-dependent hydrolase
MTRSAQSPTDESPARDIPVRRLEPFPADRLSLRFAGADPVMSHAVAVLSAMFPNGEDFFVRSVRNYRDQVSDPELRQQVNRFAGQETMHGRIHRDFNNRLQEVGFKSNVVDRSVGIGFNGVLARVLPESVQLAVTAALEHYTATLAEVLMSEPKAQELFGDEVRYLLLWHALEESEHKAVAFEVYQEVVGNELLRRAVMQSTTGVFVGGLLIGTVYSAASNLGVRDLPELVRSLARLPRSPFLAPGVLRRILSYNRPDFHPDTFDATELVNRWRADLFGTGGVLAERVRT